MLAILERTLTTNHVGPGEIETLASWQIPTAQNWGELTRLLVGPKPPRTTCIVLSPDVWVLFRSET